MTDEPAAGPGDYLVLALICLVAAFAGLFEVMYVAVYLGGVLFPVTVLVGVLTGYGLPRLGIWLTRTATGAALPLLSAVVPMLVLVFVSRPAGDVIVAADDTQWVYFALVLVCALSGFAAVVRGSTPPVSR